MPSWLQHTFVLTLVGACLLIVSRDAIRALRNQASKLAGCGSCKGCGTKEPTVAPPTPAGRVVFLSSDDLASRAAARRHSAS